MNISNYSHLYLIADPETLNYSNKKAPRTHSTETLKPKPLNPETLKPQTAEPLNPETLNPETINPETLNPRKLRTASASSALQAPEAGGCRFRFRDLGI